jgi:hypothetical protein
MLTVLAFALATGVTPPAPDRPRMLHGECIYPPAVAGKLPDASQVICDVVEVSTHGIDFQQRGWNAHSRFLGSWNGSILTVTAIQPRNTPQTEARGECRIDYANGTISLVSCTAFGGGRGWIANFRNLPP